VKAFGGEHLRQSGMLLTVKTSRFKRRKEMEARFLVRENGV